MTAAIERAGERATADAPVVWQRLEDPLERIDLRQRSWPGGEDVHLADAHVHGRWIRWREEGSA